MESCVKVNYIKMEVPVALVGSHITGSESVTDECEIPGSYCARSTNSSGRAKGAARIVVASTAGIDAYAVIYTSSNVGTDSEALDTTV